MEKESVNIWRFFTSATLLVVRQRCVLVVATRLMKPCLLILKGLASDVEYFARLQAHLPHAARWQSFHSLDAMLLCLL